MNYQTLALMLADAPRYVTAAEAPPKKKQTTEELFQSRYNAATR